MELEPELDVPLRRVLTNALTPLATAEEVRGLGVSWDSEARTALWREELGAPLKEQAASRRWSYAMT